MSIGNTISACLRKCLRWYMALWGRIALRVQGVPVPGSCEIIGAPNALHMYGRLMLGERVKLLNMPAAYPMGQMFRRCMLSAFPQATISIGNDTQIAASAICAGISIHIGERVLIGADCRIMDHDGHEVDRYPRTREYRNDGAQPIVIEDDVWLCAGVTVCKGVRIGKGSVIGTQAVVTTDIPPNVLAAGIPAKVIRPLAGQA